MLQHVLREASIKVRLQSIDRDAALAELIQGLPSEFVSEEAKRELLSMVLQRENFGTTAIGDGIAIPHCTFPGLSFPLAALGVSPCGLDYPSLDGDLVHVVFLCIFPQVADIANLKRKILHSAEVLLRDRFTREQLKNAESAGEAYQIILKEINYSLPTLKAAV